MTVSAYLAVSGFSLAVACFACGAQAGEESSVEILAAKLRSQGFACEKAESARKDEGQSHPNETVWILNCTDGSYKMTLIPNMAARIEKLSE
jgi:hypothetical protein